MNEEPMDDADYFLSTMMALVIFGGQDPVRTMAAAIHSVLWLAKLDPSEADRLRRGGDAFFANGRPPEMVETELRQLWANMK